MQCPSCGAVNRAGAKHCKVCGGVLPAAQALPPTQMVGPSLALSSPSTSGPNLLAEDGSIYPLNQAVIILGRDPSCQVAINDNRVSRQHAEIRQQGADYVLTDRGSSNGTSVNGRKITNPCSLRPGDRISFGGVVCTFQTNVGGSAPAINPGSPTPGAGVGVPAPVSSSPLVANQSNLDARQNIPSTPPVVVDQSSSQDIWNWFKNINQAKFRGKVITAPHEWQDQPPPDIARRLLLLWVIFIFIIALLPLFTFMLTLGIVLTCLGGAALLFLLRFLLMPFGMIFGGLTNWLKGDDKPVTLVNFQMQDEQTGTPVDVIFMRKRATGGRLNLGDKVEVWGKHKADESIRAIKVRVYESQGMPMSVRIPLSNPWPLWVGLLPILLSIIGVIGYLIYISSTGLYP